jgi:hypothetical protein
VGADFEWTCTAEARLPSRVVSIALSAAATSSVFPLERLLFAWTAVDATSGIETLSPGSGPTVDVHNVSVLGNHMFRVRVVDPLGLASSADVVVTRAPPLAGALAAVLGVRRSGRAPS